MMRKTLLTGIAALFLATGCSHVAYSANITVGTPAQSGTPIFIIGDISLGDERKLATLNISGRVGVYLDSMGGNAKAGLALANLIWARRYETVVSKNCSSVCAIMWLAGSKRWVTKDAHIGFHAAYFVDKDDKVTGVSPGANAVVGAFLARLGYSDSVIRTLTQTDPNSMYWLTAEKAKQLGIEVSILNEANKKDPPAPPLSANKWGENATVPHNRSSDPAYHTCLDGRVVLANVNCWDEMAWPSSSPCAAGYELSKNVPGHCVKI